MMNIRYQIIILANNYFNNSTGCYQGQIVLQPRKESNMDLKLAYTIHRLKIILLTKRNRLMITCE